MPFNPGGELTGGEVMPFQGSGLFFTCPSDHPLGPYPVVWPGNVAGVMLLLFVPLLFVKPGFPDIRPCGTKGCVTPPLPAACAEAPIVSNNPAAATNAT